MSNNKKSYLGAPTLRSDLRADPTVRTAPPVMERSVTPVMRLDHGQQREDSPAPLPPLSRFGAGARFGVQDLICTRVERPARYVEPLPPLVAVVTPTIPTIEPVVPPPREDEDEGLSRDLVCDEASVPTARRKDSEPTTDWIPLPRTLSEGSGVRTGGLCLEYYGSLDDGRPITGESALTPLASTSGASTRAGRAVLSVVIGVGLGLALAMVCAGVLLAIHG